MPRQATDLLCKAFIILFAVLLLTPLVHVFGTGIMEARNYISGECMALDGDWLIPHLFSEIRINKPPLPVWFTALANVLSPSPPMLVLHIPAIIAGALLGLFCFDLHRWICGAGIANTFAALVCLSMFMVAKQIMANNWDAYYVVFTTGALAALPGTGRASTAAGILLMAAGIMCKGPVQLYTMVLPFAAAALATRKSIPWKKFLAILLGGSLLGSLWYLYVLLAIPHVASTVAKGEALAWSARHVASFFFYLSFPVFTGIWLLPSLGALARTWTSRRNPGSKNNLFLLAWLAAGLVLISLVPEKKERYLLPVFLPLALLTASACQEWTAAAAKGALARMDSLLLRFHCILSAAAVAAACAFVAFHHPESILLEAVLALAATGLAFLTLRKKPAAVVPFTCTLALIASLAGSRMMDPAPVIVKTSPVFTRMELRAMPDLRGVPFYSLKGFGPEDEWDMGREIRGAKSIGAIPEKKFALYEKCRNFPPLDAAPYIPGGRILKSLRGQLSTGACWTLQLIETAESPAANDAARPASGKTRKAADASPAAKAAWDAAATAECKDADLTGSAKPAQ